MTHKPSRDPIREPLYRRLAALRSRNDSDNLGEQRVLADLLSPHHKCTGAVHGPTHHARANRFVYRHRLAGEHRFVNAAGTGLDDAIDGNAFSEPHAPSIADLGLFEGHVDFLAIIADAMGDLRCQLEQCPNRAARTLARS